MFVNIYKYTSYNKHLIKKRFYGTQKKVLILGWFGAKDKQLQRFNSLYNNLGCNTVISKTNIFKSMNYNNWKLWKTQGPFTEIDEQHFDIVHLFSGSAFPYHNWTLHNPNCFNHSKIIFDSSPGFPEPQHVTNYTLHLAPSLNNIPYYNQFMCNFVNKYWLNQGFDYKKGSQEFMENMNCGRDKLLIYGAKDTILDFEKIDLFYKECKKKNNNTKKVVFQNADHLQNYKLNPEEYTEEVKTFIES
jgi:hypothetical protein